jgi:hypothetical protein
MNLNTPRRPPFEEEGASIYRCHDARLNDEIATVFSEEKKQPNSSSAFRSNSPAVTGTRTDIDTAAVGSRTIRKTGATIRKFEETYKLDQPGHPEDQPGWSEVRSGWYIGTLFSHANTRNGFCLSVQFRKRSDVKRKGYEEWPVEDFVTEQWTKRQNWVLHRTYTIKKVLNDFDLGQVDDDYLPDDEDSDLDDLDDLDVEM